LEKRLEQQDSAVKKPEQWKSGKDEEETGDET
jgi:hypothetical protein